MKKNLFFVSKIRDVKREQSNMTMSVKPWNVKKVGCEPYLWSREIVGDEPNPWCRETVGPWAQSVGYEELAQKAQPVW